MAKFKLDISSIDLSRIKKEYALIACIILILIIPFFYYKNVLKPLLGRIRSAAAQIEQKKISIQKAQVGPEVLKKLEKEIEELKPRIEEYLKKLETSADIPQILRELNQIAEQLNIKFVSVNPQEQVETPLPRSKESLLQIPVKIKLKCGYHEFGKFINRIENLSRFIKITGLKITSNPKNIWVHNVELGLNNFSLVVKEGKTP